MCHYFFPLSVYPCRVIIIQEAWPRKQKIFLLPTSCQWNKSNTPLASMAPTHSHCHWASLDSLILSASHPTSIYTGTFIPFLARQEAISMCPQIQPVAARVDRMESTQSPMAGSSCSALMYHLRVCLYLTMREFTCYLTFSPPGIQKRVISLRVTWLKQCSLKCLGLIIWTICAGKGVY